MNQVERLAEAYVRARANVIKEINRRLTWGLDASNQQAVLASIEKEIGKLNRQTAAWAQTAIQESFLDGAKAAYQAVTHTIPAAAAFGGVNVRAMELCISNTQDFLQLTNGIIGRQAQDQIRQLGVWATVKKTGEGLNWQQMRRELQQAIEDEGFMTVPWRNNKGAMRVDSYARLVARTTTAEATTTGLVEQLTELDEPLIKISSYSPTCALCAARQGRVYRLWELPKDDPRNQFPMVTEGFPRWPTYKTIHPNCRHRPMPFIWSEKSREEQAAALAKAAEPMNLDPRSEAEKNAYEAGQMKNAERLRDRKQWEKYQQVLGKENVPTFSGFRAMKRAGSERFQRLQWDFDFENTYSANGNNPILVNGNAPRGISSKLEAYALNMNHDIGKNKAIVFEKALGYNSSNAIDLEHEIKKGLLHYRMQDTGDKGYGRTARVTMLITGPKGTQPVETGWIYDSDQTTPRMVTVYVSDKLHRP